MSEELSALIEAAKAMNSNKIQAMHLPEEPEARLLFSHPPSSTTTSHITDLRNALADELANHGERGAGCWCGGTEWGGDYDCHLADVVLNFLGLQQQWGKLDENEDGVLADTKEEVMDVVGGKLRCRYVTPWTDRRAKE